MLWLLQLDGYSCVLYEVVITAVASVSVFYYYTLFVKKRKYRNTVQSKYIKKKKIKSKLLQNMCTVTKVAFAFELATVM